MNKITSFLGGKRGRKIGVLKNCKHVCQERNKKQMLQDTQEISNKSATVGLLLLEQRELMGHFKG